MKCHNSWAGSIMVESSNDEVFALEMSETLGFAQAATTLRLTLCWPRPTVKAYPKDIYGP